MGVPKTKWTEEEEEALRTGVRQYGTGKWRHIQKDPELGQVLASRSNVDLKDKWRNLATQSGEDGGDDEAGAGPSGKKKARARDANAGDGGEEWDNGDADYEEDGHHERPRKKKPAEGGRPAKKRDKNSAYHVEIAGKRMTAEEASAYAQRALVEAEHAAQLAQAAAHEADEAERVAQACERAAEEAARGVMPKKPRGAS